MKRDVFYINKWSMRIFMGIVILVTYFFTAKAQEYGIRFERGRSWQQILQKAKLENKFIFVDCCATWCIPCKLMDNEVYSKEGVGDYINGHFISVKMQMDTSKSDDEFIQKWYEDVHSILIKYKVFVFPTYLFFSPDGQIVHRASGKLQDSLFLLVACQALDSAKQYYTIQKKYLLGKMKYSDMPKLAALATINGDKDLALRIEKDYLVNYLDNLNEEGFEEKVDGDFGYAIFDILTSKDRVFDWVYHNGIAVDKLMGRKGFSQMVIDNIITKEEINPILWLDEEAINGIPDWQKLTNVIESKYNILYAERNVLDAKLKWYNEKKDWPKVTKFTIQKIDEFGLDTSGLGWLFTNNILYEVIFKHSNNKGEINKAIKWMGMIVKLHPENANDIDTYANLLYKADRVRKALNWEQKASLLSPKNKTIQEGLQKMKDGVQTWE